MPLGLDSVLGDAFGSADLGVDVSAVVDGDVLLSDLDSVVFESDLFSAFDSEVFLESEAADFLYDSLR